MLALTIRVNGSLAIGDDITIYNKGDEPIRIAIDAPREIEIVRGDAKVKTSKSS